MASNSSNTSPLAAVGYGSVNVPAHVEYLLDAVSRTSGWTIAFTILAIAVAYDQSALRFHI
jgi:sterol 22-desaturase